MAHSRDAARGRGEPVAFRVGRLCSTMLFGPETAMMWLYNDAVVQ